MYRLNLKLWGKTVIIDRLVVLLNCSESDETFYHQFEHYVRRTTGTRLTLLVTTSHDRTLEHIPPTGNRFTLTKLNNTPRSKKAKYPFANTNLNRHNPLLLTITETQPADAGPYLVETHYHDEPLGRIIIRVIKGVRPFNDMDRFLYTSYACDILHCNVSRASAD